LNDSGFKTLFNGISKVEILKSTNPMKHILSHRVIFAQFITIQVNELNEELEKFSRISIQKIDKYAVSRLMELFLEKL